MSHPGIAPGAPISGNGPLALPSQFSRRVYGHGLAAALKIAMYMGSHIYIFEHCPGGWLHAPRANDAGLSGHGFRLAFGRT